MREVSSKAETRSRDRDPRARRRFVRGGGGGAPPRARGEFRWCGAGPSSETEVRSRVARDGDSVGRRGFWAVGFIHFWAAASMGSDLVIMS
jgi:hypothetical protein